eukprot:10976216-Karenia_brevis.AAC.1
MAIGRWIGQSGAFANKFPLPQHMQTEKCKFVRDAEAVKVRSVKRKADEQLSPGLAKRRADVQPSSL